MLYRILLLVGLMCPVFAGAQQSFVEGCITYTVSMDPEGDPSGMTRHAGRYRIYLKDRMIRKELELDNGFRSVILWNGATRTAYSLQATADQHYAVQLSKEDLEAAQKPYLKFKLNDTEGEDHLAGWPCRRAMVNYGNGRQGTTLCYSPAWKINEPMLFEWFPGITVLPLSFEFRNAAGVLLRFHAETIVAAPMDHALFRLPPDYRIISNQEYKKLSR